MLTEQAEQEEQDELAIEEGTMFESTGPAGSAETARPLKGPP